MDYLKSPINKLDPHQTYTTTLALVRAHPAYSHEILLLLPSAALLNNFTLLGLSLDPESVQKREQNTTFADYLTREAHASTGLYITRFVTTLAVSATTSSLSSEVGSPISPVTTNTRSSSYQSRKPSGSASPPLDSNKPSQMLYYVAAVDQDHEVRLRPTHIDHCWAKGAELIALEMGKETRNLVEGAFKAVQNIDEEGEDDHGERGRGRGMERGRRKGKPVVGDGADESEED